MKICALIATYGRPTLLANGLACFEAQSHPDRACIIVDDSGTMGDKRFFRFADSGRFARSWRFYYNPNRFPTLTKKYNWMLAEALRQWPETKAVVIQDDDDVYGPEWLSSHAAALEGHEWSHPRQVYSLHHPPAVNGVPGLESSTGRFWASAAVRVSLLQRLGGFIETARPTFDQENLAAWQREGGDPGRPDDFERPQYVYGWGRSNHVSGQMGHADWYERQRPMESVAAPVKITPEMDEQTKIIYRELWGVENPSPPAPQAETGQRAGG